MNERLLRCLALAAGMSLGVAKSPVMAREPPAYGDYGGRSFGAAVHSGVYSQSDASATIQNVGYPHGYPYGRPWHARPWYASPYRYPSYYYRPWSTYNLYYPRYYGLYYPGAYGYSGYADFGYGVRDPWPYEYAPWYGDGPWYGDVPPGPCLHGGLTPRDDAHGDFGGCYYW